MMNLSCLDSGWPHFTVQVDWHKKAVESKESIRQYSSLKSKQENGELRVIPPISYVMLENFSMAKGGLIWTGAIWAV